MTFSIVARSADGESWGVAVASKFLAVGSAVPAAVAGVGAIATQADANVAYKGLALAHLDDRAAHLRPPDLRPTSRLPDHSALTATMLVSLNPATSAASAMSAGSM